MTAATSGEVKAGITVAVRRAIEKTLGPKADASGVKPLGAETSSPPTMSFPLWRARLWSGGLASAVGERGVRACRSPRSIAQALPQTFRSWVAFSTGLT